MFDCNKIQIFFNGVSPQFRQGSSPGWSNRTTPAQRGGRRKNSYYENGIKLSFGQRLFGFKRKVSSHTEQKTAYQPVLTR